MTGEAEWIWNAELGAWSQSTEEELERAYRALDDESASAFAERSVGAVERGDVDPEEAVDLLAHLSCFVPGALRGLHGRLLDADVFSGFVTYPDVMQHQVIFRSCDSQARDRLSALAFEAPDEELGDHALSSLAWIDDDEVPRLFLRFGDHPPPWAAQAPSPAWYALRAGWELLRNGQGQPLLITAGCRRLERGVDTSSPVEVIFRLEQECGGCAGPLTVLLELDLRDERLGFLGLSGDRLRVLTCERCVCFGTVYAEVDFAGGAQWMRESDKPEVAPEWSYAPERQLGLGLKRRTPFEAHAFANRMSQVGGQAGWKQGPDYPQCPRCRRLMPAVAQVDLSEFEGLEGMIYAFLDPGCGVVATLFQS